MESGEKVRLRAYGGGEIVRRVVKVEGPTVLVCREEEYTKAEREGREPTAVGFPAQAVIGVQPSGA